MVTHLTLTETCCTLSGLWEWRGPKRVSVTWGCVQVALSFGGICSYFGKTLVLTKHLEGIFRAIWLSCHFVDGWLGLSVEIAPRALDSGMERSMLDYIIFPPILPPSPSQILAWWIQQWVQMTVEWPLVTCRESYLLMCQLLMQNSLPCPNSAAVIFKHFIFQESPDHQGGSGLPGDAHVCLTLLCGNSVAVLIPALTQPWQWAVSVIPSREAQETLKDQLGLQLVPLCLRFTNLPF